MGDAAGFISFAFLSDLSSVFLTSGDVPGFDAVGEPVGETVGDTDGDADGAGVALADGFGVGVLVPGA